MSKNLKNSTAAIALTAQERAAFVKAGYDTAAHKAKLGQMLKAGMDQGAVRQAYMTGYVRGYMVLRAGVSGYTLKQAEAAMASSGNGRSVKGKPERSEAEELAYGAARQAFAEFLKANGIVTERKQGGARPKAGKAGKGEPVAKTAATAGDARKHIETQMAVLCAYGDKHKAMLPEGYLAALLTAATAIADTKAKLAKAKPKA